MPSPKAKKRKTSPRKVAKARVYKKEWEQEDWAKGNMINFILRTVGIKNRYLVLNVNFIFQVGL